jgi:hypothetical protein
MSKRFLSGIGAVTALLVVAAAGASTSFADSRVTVQAYTRQDGASSDSTLARCSSTTPSGLTGGALKMQDEPAVAIDPTSTHFIVASANDYCDITPTFGDTWQGIYASTDGGASWTDSLLPGYPGSGDSTPLVAAGDTAATDPVLDWDNSGHLFAGGIAFNRPPGGETQGHSGVSPTNANMYVSTWNKVRVSGTAPLGIHYVRTVIVGHGTPNANFDSAGRFNDKPSLKVDDWSMLESPYAGNLYVAWTLFTAVGQDKILFARSTDGGATFSRPRTVSGTVANAQGSDIAVASNGDVYIFWRQFAFVGGSTGDGVVFVKSSDGGRTFSDPQLAFPITPYDRSDTYAAGGSARVCGSLVDLCLSGFTFPHTETLPQATADSSGNLYVAYEQLRAAADNGDSYQPDGQSQVAVQRSTDGGAGWSGPLAVDDQSVGDQFWPNLAYDSSTGKLAMIYYDSRSDPGYSVNRPPGNDASTPTTKNICIADGVGTQPCDVLDTYIATSTNGGASWLPNKVSSVGNQPNYEMFGNRTDPFFGDYIWVDARGGRIYGTWTDNRDVVPGSDIREDPDPTRGDGFDVHQCRTSPTAPDTCGNAGGLDQNVYGGSP